MQTFLWHTDYFAELCCSSGPLKVSMLELRNPTHILIFFQKHARVIKSIQCSKVPLIVEHHPPEEPRTI